MFVAETDLRDPIDGHRPPERGEHEEDPGDQCDPLAGLQPADASGPPNDAIAQDDSTDEHYSEAEFQEEQVLIPTVRHDECEYCLGYGDGER